MQKNEFEKQVRQKMEELKLVPSDSVWPNIESHISKKKRRKIAWIIFPTLIICLCGGYWLIDSTNKLKSHRQNKLSQDFIKKDSSKIPFSSQPGKDATVPAPPKKILFSSSAADSEKKSSSNEDKPGMGFTKSNLNKKAEKINSADLKSNIVQPDAIAVEDENVTYKGEENLNEIDSTLVHNNNTDSALAAITNNIRKTEDIKDAAVKSEKTKIPKHDKTKSSWTWGFNFSMGISGVPTKFLGALDKSFADRQAFYSTSSPQNTFAPLPSKIKSSTALIAGFFLEKNISKSKMITAGINYKMFSATNKVGKKSDSLQGYSLNNPVNNYHHYYHFIELAVSLKIQISPKKPLLFWDAGISLSQLISSNALQFNNNSIIYYQNNSLFNKSQMGFNTGFSASLFSNKNASALIGPYIYYGTTKIAEEGLYKNQHFTFIGLRSQILFKK